MPKKTPSYRQRKGYDQAIVTLTDARTKKRRDYWLGAFGSHESRQRHHRLLAEWEAKGRALPDAFEDRPTDPKQTKVSEVIIAYWKYAESYDQISESHCIKVALRLLRHFYGQTPATAFGPRKLRFLRTQMIRGDDRAEPSRQVWSRTYINQQVMRIRHMFKWAASYEMVPITVYQQLASVESLKRGQPGVRENAPSNLWPLNGSRPFGRTSVGRSMP